MMKFAVSLLIPSAVFGCLQLDFVGVRNTGKITDYLSGSDEIDIHLGVSAFFQFASMHNHFSPN